MAPERDYTGVSTGDLAKLIRTKMPEGREEWAEANEFDKRQIRWILEERYAFTGLGIADAICTALDARLEDHLTVVPRASAKAAIRMATDELELFFEFVELPPPSRDQIEARAEELMALRHQVLGPPNLEQVERLREDSERSKARLARKRNAAAGVAA